MTGPISTTPKVWLDASDLSTLFQNSGGTEAVTTDGDPVGYWGDKSGNNNHVTQSISGKRPTYKTDIQNGLPVIRFDGVDDYLHSVAFGTPLSQPNTVYLIHKVLTYGEGSIMLDTDASGANRYRFDTEGFLYHIYAGSDVDSSFFVDTAFVKLLRVLVDGANTEFDVQGTVLTPGNPGSNSLGGLTLGAKYDGTLPMNVQVCEVLVYNASLNSDDKATILSYLRNKWLHNVITSTPDPLPRARSGKILVETAGVAVRGPDVPGGTFMFVADIWNNGEPVWIGNDGSGGVSRDTGFPVTYYGYRPVEIKAGNLNELYFDVEVDGDIICWERIE